MNDKAIQGTTPNASPPSPAAQCSAEGRFAEAHDSADVRKRFDRIIFLLSEANKATMDFHAHNLIERSMIEVGFLRDREHRKPPND